MLGPPLIFVGTGYCTPFPPTCLTAQSTESRCGHLGPLHNLTFLRESEMKSAQSRKAKSLSIPLASRRTVEAPSFKYGKGVGKILRLTGGLLLDVLNHFSLRL